MTIEEAIARESIRDTIARYTMAGDRLRVDAFAATFAEDGILHSGPPDRPNFRCEGREAIRRWFSAPRSLDSGDPGRERPRFVRHHLATSAIELIDRDHARARTCWTVYTQIGVDHRGIYRDTLRRTAEGWLFAERLIRSEWHSQNGLFRPAGA